MKHLAARVHMSVAAILLCCAANAQAKDAKQVRVDIGEQPVLGALKELGEQTGLQLLMRVDGVAIDNIVVQPVSGQLSLKVALDKLLANTGLTYEFVNDRTIRISRAKSRPTSSIPYASSESFRVAKLADVAVTDATGGGRAESTARPSSSKGESNSGPMEQVVVTAQKREERLIDTPQSVSVLSDEYLNKVGALQLRDFQNTVPGMVFTTQGAGYSQISLRGVTTGTIASQLVGIYLDDVPYGSSTTYSGGNIGLDAALFDVDRIEVLRGPQGTLYGASTMGGLIKYVSKAPSADEFDGNIRAGLSNNQQGGLSYNAAAAINAPLVSGKAALRVSAYESHDGGYVDNVGLRRDDVDRSDVYGGRIDLMFAPTDVLTIRVGAFLQNITRDGQSTVDYTRTGAPQSGELDQSRLYAEPFDQRFRLASATVDYAVGGARLTSVSSYQTSVTNVTTDFSRIYVPLLGLPLFGARAYSAVGARVDLETDKFTQEIRLASDEAKRIEWLIGAYYADEKSGNEQAVAPVDRNGQPALNDLFTSSFPTTYEEYAGFGDLTFHLTSKFDVSGGVRYARHNVSYRRNGTGLLNGGVTTTPVFKSHEGVSTYLANARYHFTDDATGYVRFATGFRPGGPNNIRLDPFTGLPLAPPTFDSDSLKSYEAGFKAETAGGAFGFDIAGYYIDWNSIQLAAVRSGFGIIANAGKAVSRGVELTVSGRPVNALAISTALNYQDAHLAEAAPDLRARDGERLPNVPRFMGSLNVDYDFGVDGIRPSIGITGRYVGERTASFDSSTSFPQYRLPSYTAVDVRTGLKLSSLNLQLYVRNVLDKRGQVSAFYLNNTHEVAMLQPRTYGVTVTTRF